MIEFNGCSTCDNPYQKVVLIMNGMNYCQECDLAGKWKFPPPKEVQMAKKLDTLIRASQALNPWYTIDASFKNGLISVGIYSTVNHFCLAWSDAPNFNEALDLLSQQLLRDSLPTGRYADNGDFQKMFEKAALELSGLSGSHQNSKGLF